MFQRHVTAVLRSSLAAGALATAPLALRGQGDGTAFDATIDLRIDGNDKELLPTSLGIVDRAGTMMLAQGSVVRRFDARGKELKPSGRAGAGPGEFRMISNGGLVGDTLWLTDPILRRTTWLSPDGKVLRTAGWPKSASRAGRPVPQVLGVQPYAVRGASLYSVLRLPKNVDAPAWWPSDTVTSLLVEVDSGGAVIRTVSALPTTSSSPCLKNYVSVASGPGSLGVPFCPWDMWRMSGQGNMVLIVRQAPEAGATGEFVVTGTRLDGSPAFSYRGKRAVVAIPKAERDRARTAALGPAQFGIPFERRQALASMQIPDHYPPIDELYVGNDGTSWLRTGVRGPQRHWLILSAGGVPVGTVSFPHGFQFLTGTQGEVWGVVLDDDDVPSLVRYKLSPRK